MARLVKRLVCSTRMASLALVGGLAMTTFGSVSTAHADSTDELLDLLRRKGAINKKEYAVIKSRHAAEKARGGGMYVRGDAGPPPRYVTALDKGIGVRIPGASLPFTKGGPTGTVGDVDVTLSGNVNAYYVQQSGKASGPSGAGIDGAVNPLPNKTSSSISDGLLPSAVILDIATKQGGYDISGTFGFYTGINGVNGAPSNAQSPGNTHGTPGIDVKLAYLKVGSTWGTFEAGRDFALYGQDILIFDFNELSVGNPINNTLPNNGADGTLGTGYVLGGFVPQFRYTTPNYNGFTITGAVSTPQDAVAPPKGAFNFASKHDTPQFTARLKYEGSILPNAKLTAWATGITQDVQNLAPTEAGFGPFKNSFQVYGGEAGAKLTLGNFEALGYGYYGKGLGTSVVYNGGLDFAGNGRESYGYLAQAGYTFFERLTISGGYGNSFLHRTAADVADLRVAGDPLGIGANLKQATQYTGTARYSVTKWLALVAQYSHVMSKSVDQSKIETDNYIGGAQIFF